MCKETKGIICTASNGKKVIVSYKDNAILDKIYAAANRKHGLHTPISVFCEKSKLDKNRTTQYIRQLNRLLGRIEYGDKIPGKGNARAIKWVGPGLSDTERADLHEAVDRAKHPQDGGFTPTSVIIDEKTPQEMAKIIADMEDTLVRKGYKRDENGQWYKETRVYL